MFDDTPETRRKVREYSVMGKTAVQFYSVLLERLVACRPGEAATNSAAVSGRCRPGFALSMEA